MVMGLLLRAFFFFFLSNRISAAGLSTNQYYPESSLSQFVYKNAPYLNAASMVQQMI